RSAVPRPFPTRRSSDLISGDFLPERRGARVVSAVLGPRCGTAPSAAAAAAEALAGLEDGAGDHFADVAAARTASIPCVENAGKLDRKSTRLNSSHVKIS